MATADQYAQWIVDNQDKKGSEEFNTVSQAYQEAKQQESGTEETKPENDISSVAVPAAAAAAVPAVPAVAKTVANAPQTIRDIGTIAKPVASGAWQAGKGLVGTYLTNPGSAAVDITATHLGLPPPVASDKVKPLYQGIKDTTQNIKDYYNKTGQFTPKAPVTPVNPGQQAFNNITNQLGGSEMAQAGEVASRATPEELVHAASNNMNTQQVGEMVSAREKAQAAAKAAETAKIASTQGEAAVQGSKFIPKLFQEFGEKYGPAVSKAVNHPLVNNPVTRTAGSAMTGAMPLQVLQGAAEQAGSANMNDNKFNVFGSTARAGKSFADWVNEVTGQNKKYANIRAAQRAQLNGQ